MWLPLNKAMSTVSWYEDWMLKFALQAGLTAMPGSAELLAKLRQIQGTGQ